MPKKPPSSSAEPEAAPALAYKVVEASTVTDEALESIINTYVSRGWRYDGMQFAMRESSKRPAMAFVLFTRSSESKIGDGE